MPAEMEAHAHSGDMVEYTFFITNTGTLTDYYNLNLSSTWEAELSVESPVQINPGESIEVTVSVTIPIDAHSGDQDTAVITASSLRDEAITDTITFTTSVLYRMQIPLAMKN